MNKKNHVKIILGVTIYFLFLMITPPVESIGRSGASSFLLTAGARPLGMGEAFTGMADDVNAIQYNVAGLTNISCAEAGLMYHRGIADTNLGFAAYAQPLGKIFHIGLSFAVMDAGDVEITTIEFDNRAGTRKAKQDFIFSLGVAHSLSFLGNIGEKFSLGVGSKLLKTTLAEESSATVFAGDIGLILKLFENKISIGFTLQNLGNEVKYTGGIATGEVGDPLPLTMRFGTTYTLLKSKAHQLIGSAEMNKMQDSDIRFNGGIEYWIKNIFAFRVGYKTVNNESPLTSGVGFRIGKLQLDYGFGLMENVNHFHRASLIIRFGSRK